MPKCLGIIGRSLCAALTRVLFQANTLMECRDWANRAPATNNAKSRSFGPAFCVTAIAGRIVCECVVVSVFGTLKINPHRVKSR
jgi:hypothetical protein